MLVLSICVVLSHPQSDPFVEIAKAQEGGVFTVVYRSQPIMKTLDPKCVILSNMCYYFMLLYLSSVRGF